MTYKILVVKNRIKSHKIKKAIDWFKGKVPVDFSIEELVTDFDVTTKKMSNATFSGVVCGDDLYDKLRSVIPEHKYHCIIFTYGNDLNGIRVNYCPYLPLYKHTDLIQLCDADKYTRANHELFHALIHKAQRQGASFNDPMDSYLKDWDLEVNSVIDTNREMALNLLKYWWDKILKLDDDIPTVTITRISDDGVQTLGELQYGTFWCKTLERPWKDNKSNISCIPKGTYNCKYTFSPKFMKYTYLLEGTNPRSSIRIHSGNFWFDIQGCILLGDSYKDLNSDKRVDILNSRLTVNKFEQLLGKRPFRLIIK